MNWPRPIGIWACWLALCWATPSLAQDVAEQPWEVGVDEASRAAALELFGQGNELFTESEYLRAAEKYRAALTSWDHPRIHGNLATVLINLDDPIKALEHIDRALARGAGPFEAHVHTQLLTHRKLLEAQLTTLRIRCSVDGVAVTLDGKPLFTGPGDAVVRVRSGSHQAVARKKGHLTQTRNVSAAGGDTLDVTLKPIPLSEATSYERRWTPWIPWTVAGGGAVLALSGFAFGRASVAARDDYEAGLRDGCPSGCAPEEVPEQVYDDRDRAELFNAFEVTGYLVGGAAIVTGTVLIILNQERPVFTDESGERLSVVPLLSPGQLGAALHWSSDF
jgi:hypothetical protein